MQNDVSRLMFFGMIFEKISKEYLLLLTEDRILNMLKLGILPTFQGIIFKGSSSDTNR